MKLLPLYRGQPLWPPPLARRSPPICRPPRRPSSAPVLVSPWDFDVGATLTSDYLFRGITQSNHQPSVWGRGELRYNWSDNWQFYAGVSGESIKFTTNFFPVGTPAMELDGAAGVRGTFDKLSFDLGGIVYGYPDSPTGTHLVFSTFLGAYPIGLAPRNPTFFEVYLKPTYTLNDCSRLASTTSSRRAISNTGANGEYLSGTVKVTGQGNLVGFRALWRIRPSVVRQGRFGLYRREFLPLLLHRLRRFWLGHRPSCLATTTGTLACPIPGSSSPSTSATTARIWASRRPIS